MCIHPQGRPQKARPTLGFAILPFQGRYDCHKYAALGVQRRALHSMLFPKGRRITHSAIGRRHIAVNNNAALLHCDRHFLTTGEYTGLKQQCLGAK